MMSHPTLVFCLSLREQLFKCSFQIQKNKIKTPEVCGRSQEFMKSHILFFFFSFFLNGRARHSVRGQNWFYATSPPLFFWFFVKCLGQSIWAFVCEPSVVFCHTVVLFTHLPQRVGPNPRTPQDRQKTPAMSVFGARASPSVILLLGGWNRPVGVWNLTWTMITLYYWHCTNWERLILNAVDT